MFVGSINYTNINYTLPGNRIDGDVAVFNCLRKQEEMPDFLHQMFVGWFRG